MVAEIDGDNGSTARIAIVCLPDDRDATERWLRRLDRQRLIRVIDRHADRAPSN